MHEGRFVPEQETHEGFVNKSRREFLKSTAFATGAIMGSSLFLERPALANPELKQMRTWRAGAEYLRDAAKYGLSEQLTAFRCDHFDSHLVHINGEWLASQYGDNSSVGDAGPLERFIDESEKKNIKVVVVCHTHPRDFPDTREPQRLLTRKGFFGRRQKEYRDSNPPSFMDAPNQGDAVMAYEQNIKHGNKIDMRYRVFDQRGIWKYGINMHHKYWQDFGRVKSEYDQVAYALLEDTDMGFVMKDQLKKFGNGRDALEAMARIFKGSMSKELRMDIEEFLVDYDECLVRPYRTFRMVRDIAVRSHIEKSRQALVPDAHFVQGAYQLMGVSVEYETYESLGLEK